MILPPETAPSESGQLSFIDNQVDVTTGTIRLKATCQNDEGRLWPGQFVQVVLNLSVEPGVRLIPSRAVQAGQQGPFVFVVKDDMTVEMRPVTVRRAVGDDSVLDAGLEAGERVVIDGQLRLVPGAKVQIKEGQKAEGGGQKTEQGAASRPAHSALWPHHSALLIEALS